MEFDKIYETQYQRMVCFARNCFNLQHDEAEEIVTDAFLDLHRAQEKGIEIECPAAWIRVALRVNYAKFLRHKLRVKRGGRFQKHRLINADLLVEHREFDAIDITDMLQSVWDHLTEMDQKIATLIFMQEFSKLEVAKQLGIAERTVERRMNQIRKRLRVLLLSPFSFS